MTCRPTPDGFMCGGSGHLSPAAEAELVEFSTYLREKADAKREGKPWPQTFIDWKLARDAHKEPK